MMRSWLRALCFESTSVASLSTQLIWPAPIDLCKAAGTRAVARTLQSFDEGLKRSGGRLLLFRQRPLQLFKRSLVLLFRVQHGILHDGALRSCANGTRQAATAIRALSFLHSFLPSFLPAFLLSLPLRAVSSMPACSHDSVPSSSSLPMPRHKPNPHANDHGISTCR